MQTLWDVYIYNIYKHIQTCIICIYMCIYIKHIQHIIYIYMINNWLLFNIWCLFNLELEIKSHVQSRPGRRGHPKPSLATLVSSFWCSSNFSCLFNISCLWKDRGALPREPPDLARRAKRGPTGHSGGAWPFRALYIVTKAIFQNP